RLRNPGDYLRRSFDELRSNGREPRSLERNFSCQGIPSGIRGGRGREVAGRGTRGARNRRRIEMLQHRIGTIVTVAGIAILASPLLAMAQETAGAAGGGAPLRAGLIAIAANIGIGIAAFGSALG